MDPVESNRSHVFMEEFMKKYCYYTAPFGEVLLVEENGSIEQIVFPKSPKNKHPDPDWKLEKSAFKKVTGQLDEYFEGKRKIFSITINLIGTEFQKMVWKELAKIPYGSTICYGELANRIGNPKASRAVGAANGKNPIPIIIPCHRVIGKDGRLVGFGGGIPVKKHLLQLENRSRG